MIGEAALGQGFEHEAFELRGHRHAVYRLGFFRRLSREGFSLDELALHRIERRQLMMPCLQRAHFRLNAEQGRDEVFQMRRQFDDQFGTLFGIERGGI